MRLSAVAQRRALLDLDLVGLILVVVLVVTVAHPVPVRAQDRAAAAAAPIAAPIAAPAGTPVEGVATGSVVSPAPPLGYDHWSYELLDALDASGVASAWMTTVRPAGRLTAARELRRARDLSVGARPLAAAWAARFEREFPLGERSEGSGASAGWEIGGASGVRSGHTFLDRGDGAFAAASFVGTVGRVAFWGTVEQGAREAFDGVQSVGVSVPAGPFDVMIGRQRILGAGPGPSSVHFSGEVPIDGLYVVSNRPIALPWTEWLLGSTVWQFSLAPIRERNTPERSLIGLIGVVVEPHPHLRIGATRSARFAGTRDPSLAASRFIRTLLMVQNDPFNWDDHMLELSLRYRWKMFGQPLAMHLVLAQEDSPLWKDPGLQIGVSAPFLHTSGLYNVHYDYRAYGQRARWCPGCFHDRANWFSHGRHGPHDAKGIPVGDPLGGYGANHTGSVLFFSADGRNRARAWTSFAVREEGNLLHARWPGKRREGGLEIGRELSGGVEGSLAGVVADGPRIAREWGLRISLSAVLGGAR